MDSTRRFSDRASYYARWRPGYPDKLVEFISSQFGLSAAGAIADVGSGTGRLTETLVKLGGKVYAVEPNDEMRSAAEKILGENKRFVSVNGTAEATGLADASVQLVTAGQAFHWFDPVGARREFVRILSSPGWAALVWNERKSEAGSFGAAYGALTEEFKMCRGGNPHSVEAMAEFFKPARMELATFGNRQVLSFEGLVGRILSSSTAPLPGQNGHEEMMQRTRCIFDRYQSGGVVTMEYDTRVYYGQIR